VGHPILFTHLYYGLPRRGSRGRPLCVGVFPVLVGTVILVRNVLVGTAILLGLAFTIHGGDEGEELRLRQRLP